MSGNQEKSGLELWNKSLEGFQNEFHSRLEESEHTESPVKLWRVSHALKLHAHRVKGLSSMSGIPHAPDWLQAVEHALSQLCSSREILDHRSNLRMLEEIVKSGPADGNWEKRISEIPEPRTLSINQSKSETRVELVSIPWADELIERLDRMKQNLVMISRKENFSLQGVKFSISLERISELQELDFEDDNLIVLDVWPGVEKQRVNVRCVFLSTDTRHPVIENLRKKPDFSMVKE